MTEHTKLVNKAIQYCNSFAPHVDVFKKDQGPTSGRKGISDIIGFAWGKFIAIEIKIGKDKLRPLQKRYLDTVEAGGCIAAVCWTLEDVKRVIERVRG